MKVKRALFAILTAIFSLAAAGFAWLWWGRGSLPYNEEGRWFDPVDALVYYEQAVETYGALALWFAALAILSIVLWRRSSRRI